MLHDTNIKESVPLNKVDVATDKHQIELVKTEDIKAHFSRAPVHKANDILL